MRHLLRSLAALSALAVCSSLAVHAATLTYIATPTITDLDHPGNLAVTFASPTISFVNPPTSSFTDNFSIVADYGNYVDDVVLKVAFTSPGTGSGSITDDLTIHSFLFFTGGNLTWDFLSTNFTLSNGSLVTLSVPTTTIALNQCGFQSCGSSSFTVSVTNPTVAPTPEPSSLALLGTGVLGLAGVVRRKLAI